MHSFFLITLTGFCAVESVNGLYSSLAIVSKNTSFKMDACQMKVMLTLMHDLIVYLLPCGCQALDTERTGFSCENPPQQMNCPSTPTAQPVSVERYS